MRDNPYPGINAHFNSLLQTPGTEEQPALWHAFHQHHIGHIVDALNELLPNHYIALSEHSLQTRGMDDFGSISISEPRPDVSIFQRGEGSSLSASAVLARPTWEAALADVLEPIKHPNAVLIREVTSQRQLGQSVARIELLSPANKPNGRHHDAYNARRAESLESGVPLIEIDYLHEAPPVIYPLPIYPHDERATPYMVIVSDPRPDWLRGTVKVYGFGVFEAIKPFTLPLSGEESVTFDLTTVYNRTFKAGRWGDLMDYTVQPVRFGTYSAADQGHIMKMMSDVK